MNAVTPVSAERVRGVLLALAAVAFAVASAIHFGVDVPVGFTTISDSFPGAATPEAVIAAVLAFGAVTVLTRRTYGRKAALGSTSFATLGTVFGLTITLSSGRTGDVAYHLGILAVLVVILGLLLAPHRPQVGPARKVGDDTRRSIPDTHCG